MDFKFDDKPLESADVPRIVQRAIEYLEELNDGEFVTLKTLASRLNVSHGYLSDYTVQYLDEYSIRTRHNGTIKRFLGNKNTVEAWKTKQSQ